MSRRALFLATFLWLGCSADPMPLMVPGDDTLDTGTSSSPGRDTDTGLATVGSDSETPSAPDTTPIETEEPVDTVDPGDCPWQCLALTGPNACAKADKDGSFHNPNYECGNEGYVCCQPPNAKGGIKQPCNDQPAMSCQAACGDGLVQNTGFYCSNANFVCCEDPNGPAPTCAEVGGTCIPPFFWECDEDETETELECESFGEKCCVPPECPWGCVPFVDENTCSQGKNPPVAVRNYDYSCPKAGEACCEPLETIDTDTSDTDTGGLSKENCNQQGALFSCEASCGDYESQHNEFYCPSAGAKCCEDIREDCESMGGTCDNELFGGCADLYEANPGGRCESSWLGTPDCCTPISPNNQCAKDGGTCVEVGAITDPTELLTLCPLGYTPDIQTLCGDFRMCCKSILGG